MVAPTIIEQMKYRVDKHNRRKAKGVLPNPNELGAPDKYNQWRPDQDEVVEWITEQDARFVVAGVGTGAGKSLIGVLSGIILSNQLFPKRSSMKDPASGLVPRTLILTHRISLAHQYYAEFASTGMREIHGIRNYNPNGTVNDPAFEGLSYNYCLAEAQTAPLVVTTYAYFLASKFGRGLGNFDVMVMDEAHTAFDALSSFFDVTLKESDFLKWRIGWPGRMATPEDWGNWIVKANVTKRLEEHKARITEEIVATGGNSYLNDMYDEVSRLLTGTSLIMTQKGEWICDQPNYYEVRLAKVWPGEESMERLFGKMDKVVLMSGTIRPKTMDLLGVEHYAFREWDHPFHPDVRPVYWMPTITAVESKADEFDWRRWVTRIDNIASKFMNVGGKGIVHTVSYKRGKMYEKESQHTKSGAVITHDKRNTAEMVSWFKDLDVPTILVSPVLTTGWDMPEAEWQVIGKVPWPYTQDPLLKARMAHDKEYSHYTAMQELVQMAGRIVRGPSWEERGVTVLIDDTWAWFWRFCEKYAPSWFKVWKKTDITELI